MRILRMVLAAGVLLFSAFCFFAAVMASLLWQMAYKAGSLRGVPSRTFAEEGLLFMVAGVIVLWIAWRILLEPANRTKHPKRM